MVHKVLLELGCRGRRVIRVTQEHRVIQEGPRELRVFKELKELLEMAHRVLLVLREPTEIMATQVLRVL